MARTHNLSERGGATTVPEKRRRLSKEDRRGALLAMGLKLFGERPYHELTTRDICAAADISPPLLQHYFGNKRTYFLAVMARAVELLEQTARPSPGDQPFQSMTRLVEVYFNFLLHHPAGATLSMKQGSGMDEELQQLFDPFRERTFQLVAEALGVDGVDGVVALAIRSWVGLNETVALQLLDRPAMTPAVAAHYSGLALFSLIRSALTATGRAMPADWQQVERAIMAGPAAEPQSSEAG